MASQTLGGAIQNLVSKQNQTVITGLVQEVRLDGQVFVRVKGVTIPVDSGATDQPMQAGMQVRLAKNDKGGWVLLGGM
jgi:hypothetical protein